MPARAFERDTEGGEAVDGGVGEALGLAVVPAEAAEDAEVFGEFLIGAHPEAVFQSAGLAGGSDVGARAGLLGKAYGVGVSAAIKVIEVREQADGALVVAPLAAQLAFEHVGAIAEELAVEAQAVGDARHGGAGIADGPVAGVELVDPAPGVAARIGGIIPRAVIHHGPAHELGARIVGVVVVVEEIGDGKAADGDGVTRHGAAAGERVLIALSGFAFAAETEILGYVEPRDVRLGGGRSDAGHFAVGEIGEAIGAAEAAAAGDFGVEIKQGVGRQAQAEEKGGCERGFGFGVALQAERAGIERRETAVILADGSGLEEEIPALIGRGVLRGQREGRGGEQGDESGDAQTTIIAEEAVGGAFQKGYRWAPEAREYVRQSRERKRAVWCRSVISLITFFVCYANFSAVPATALLRSRL